MGQWFRLASASFAATVAVVMIGAVNEQLQRSGPALRQVALAAPEARASVSVPVVQAAMVVQRTTEPVVQAVVHAPVAEPELLPAASDEAWSPPLWFPEESRESLWALEGVSGEAVHEGRGLRLNSRAAFVYDVDAGEVLLDQGADDRRPVASLTKLISGLATVSERPDLDREICMDPSLRPSWPGAATRLKTNTCTTGWDLLGAALVRSDNAAAYALAPVSGLPHYPFVERMNQVALDLGMDQSTFSDPSGAEDDNLSTARDMTRAVLAAALHPDLAPVVAAPFWDVTDNRRARTRRMFTTNLLSEQGRLEFFAAKTGYTDTARNCFSAVVRTGSGRKVAFTVLGGYWSRHRWSDVRRLLDWVERL